MKLRNKLVAVLAASMVVTSVPVVTMADTTNYMSTSRYAQKDGTFGYINGNYAGYDNVYGQAAAGIGGSSEKAGYEYKFSNGFEFIPTFDYSQTDTTYMSLTADSEFNTKAMVAYVDAFNSTNGKTNLQFDASGNVVTANNPDYIGKSADDIMKAGVTMYYADTNGISNSVAVSSATGNTYTVTSSVAASDVNKKARDVFKARVKAAGDKLYTAQTNDTMLADVETAIASALDTTLASGATVNAVDKVASLPATVTAVINAQVAAVEKNNAEISTTYAQYYKSNNGVKVINTAILNDILNATTLEVNAWVIKQSTTTGAYEAWLAGLQGTEKAQATIRKVDMINFKDANDREYKSHLRIDSRNLFKRGSTYKLPVLAKLGGDKTVILDVNGKDSNITSGKYNLTQDKLTDKRLTVEAGSEKIRPNYMDKIGEIKFTESQIKSLISADNRKIKIELPRTSDLEFNLTKTLANAKAKGNRGFYNTATAGETKPEKNVKLEDLKSNAKLKDGLRIAYGVTNRRNNYTDVDTQTLIVELPYWMDATSVGQVILSDIYVQPMDDTAKIGDVNATISEYIAEGATSSKLVDSTTVKVAEVKEYDITLTCDGSPASIKAGRSGIMADKKVTFILEEAVKDSLVDGRKIKFVVENGYIFGPADIDYSTAAANSNGVFTTGLYGTTAYKEKAEAKFKELIANEKIKFEEKAGKDGNNIGFDESTLTLEMDAEGRVIGFAAQYPRLKDSEADKIKVTMPIATDVMSKGEVKVKAENLYTRSFQDKKEDPSCVIANITAPIEVSFDGAKLKVGKQAQEAGSITIKETDKSMLENGWLFLAAQDQAGITFDGVPTVKVEGEDGKTLVVKNVALSKDKTMLGLEITRESSAASTIKIEGINLTADRTVPEANYDLAIWGTSLTDENELGITNFTQNALYSHAYFNQASDIYTVEKFIQMTTANTEDLSSAAKAVTTEFVIGESKFTVNGETVQMDSKAYIKDGLTFVPVRYLAQAFGIAGNAVQYNKATATATIVSGDKVINITNGKAYLVVNGTEVPMASKAEVKDGRMCVPMAYIAAALGIDKSWDASAKKATFTNQSK